MFSMANLEFSWDGYIDVRLLHTNITHAWANRACTTLACQLYIKENDWGIQKMIDSR